MIAMQMMHLPDDSAYKAAGGNPLSYEANLFS